MASNKLEEMLESMQPYPGDPVNVLQFKGWQFVVTPISHNELLVQNQVLDLFEVLLQNAIM